jgi:aminopeptidase N
MLGRLLAVEQLSGRKDALAKLKEALNHDAFYGVRLEASKSLRAIQTDEALSALLASPTQPDARVRRQVAMDIRSFYRDAAYANAWRLLGEEKNPEIKATAISSLGAWPKAEVREKLLEYLKSESYRNELADAAINAIRGQDDAVYVEPLREVLAKEEAAFTATGFSRGLDTLAWLARNEEKKDVVREFLLARLNHPKPRVQQAAITALGTLGDPKAIAVLDKLSGVPQESPERLAAERAMASLRDGKKPGVELGAIRGEVLNLQKENRELRRDLEELKKKLEAMAPKPEAAKSGPTVSPGKMKK